MRSIALEIRKPIQRATQNTFLIFVYKTKTLNIYFHSWMWL